MWIISSKLDGKGERGGEQKGGGGVFFGLVRYLVRYFSASLELCSNTQRHSHRAKSHDLCVASRSSQKSLEA